MIVELVEIRPEPVHVGTSVAGPQNRRIQKLGKLISEGLPRRRVGGVVHRQRVVTTAAVAVGDDLDVGAVVVGRGAIGYPVAVIQIRTYCHLVPAHG
ncbi:hypothetical protein BMS3Bbin02_02021 [bacterium BMS3Bbin02]|nr:hypothetical protein BMS3Bbin02_02021 [bacterium BMS3Bbin02]